MTFQQLRIVLEVSKTGSISKAADNLYISQPNASSSIRTLEKDIGYAIFTRTNVGMELTEQGFRFIEHARRVLGEVEQMEDLKNDAHVYRFHLGVLSYAPTIEAFLQLCREYASCEKADLSCVNTSDMAGIRAVGNMELDMMAMLLSSKQLPRVQDTADSYGLQMSFVKSIALNINLREGHPLLQAGDTPALSGLAAYPYVAYASLPNLVETASSIADEPIRYKYRIAVDERDTRCRIVSTTDAFSIGCRMPHSLMERYHLVSVRVSGASGHLYCIVRKGEQNREEIRRYTEILQEKVKEL